MPLIGEKLAADRRAKNRKALCRFPKDVIKTKLKRILVKDVRSVNIKIS